MDVHHVHFWCLKRQEGGWESLQQEISKLPYGCCEENLEEEHQLPLIAELSSATALISSDTIQHLPSVSRLQDILK